MIKRVCVPSLKHVELICILQSICFLKTIHQNWQCGDKCESVVVFWREEAEKDGSSQKADGSNSSVAVYVK